MSAGETITVTVRDRLSENWGSGLGRVVTKRVTISVFCPQCGGRRGEPSSMRLCDDGEWYSVHAWVNPCGHTDYYADVLAEASVQYRQNGDTA